MSIVRYLARKAGKMYGNNPGETASVDQWLEFINSQFSGIFRIMYVGLFGYLIMEISK